MKIGVLALQGAFEEHIKKLNELSVDAFEIRQPKDLDEMPDGLIIPGGESTVMSKLLDDLDIRHKILEYAASGMPVFGTCAGLILMSKQTGDARCDGLGLIDCTAKRNAYGRQLEALIQQRILRAWTKFRWYLSARRTLPPLVTESMCLQGLTAKSLRQGRANFLPRHFTPS